MQIRATPPDQPIDLIIHTPGWPAGALIHLAQKKPAELVSDQMWLLAEKLPQEVAAQTAEFLTGGYLAHDTPITLDAARNLGLPVNTNMPGRVYGLFETCVFGLCKRPCLAAYGMATAPTAGLERSEYRALVPQDVE